MAFTLVTGKPRTPPHCPRCQNWLSGLPATLTPREILHPAVPLTLIFLFIGLSGLPAAVLYGKPRTSSRRSRYVFFLGSFFHHWIFVQNFWGGGGENEGETGRKILRGFQQSFQAPRFCSLGRRKAGVSGVPGRRGAAGAFRQKIPKSGEKSRFPHFQRSFQHIPLCFPPPVWTTRVVNKGRKNFHSVFKKNSGPQNRSLSGAGQVFHRFHAPYYYDYQSL